jgi:hypothetical protein
MYRFILSIHLAIITIFLAWYFCLGGYLGYGYGELVYISIIIVVQLISLILLFRKRTKSYQLPVYIFLIIFYLWSWKLLQIAWNSIANFEVCVQLCRISYQFC